jgi:hypothetical protein
MTAQQYVFITCKEARVNGWRIARFSCAFEGQCLRTRRCPESRKGKAECPSHWHEFTGDSIADLSGHFSPCLIAIFEQANVLQKAIHYDKITNTMKTAKTFRLSEQAINQLQALKKRTGTNETAIVEIALALFERGIIEGLTALPLGGVPSVVAGGGPSVIDEQAEEQELLKKFPGLKGMQMSFPHSKKRKRK